MPSTNGTRSCDTVRRDRCYRLRLGKGMEEALDLEDRWREILDFERGWWKSSTAKTVAVRDRFGLSPARYYQLLNRVIDRPEALTYDPMLVHRLRRLRASRRRKRFTHRLGLEG
jgi:hypothetical protein